MIEVDSSENPVSFRRDESDATFSFLLPFSQDLPYQSPLFESIHYGGRLFFCAEPFRIFLRYLLLRLRYCSALLLSHPPHPADSTEGVQTELQKKVFENFLIVGRLNVKQWNGEKQLKVEKITQTSYFSHRVPSKEPNCLFFFLRCSGERERESVNCHR